MATIGKLGKKKILLIAAAALVVLLLAVYLGVGIFFQSHFQFRTVINGVDCSGKSIPEVEKLIAAELESYQLTLVERGNGTETIQGQAIDVRPVFDGSLKKEMSSRNGFAWPASLFQQTKIKLETMVEFDEGLLEQCIEELQCLKPENMEKPRDAYVSSYIEGKGYEIIPEEEGTTVDVKALTEVVKAAVVNLEEEVSLEENQCYTEPDCRQDNEKLVKTAEELNKYVAASITYDVGQEEVLDGKTIQEWITVDEENQITIDEEKIAEYVDSLAEKYDTAKRTRSIKTSYGSTVNLGWNEYGWKIDQEQEEAKILENIKAGEKVSREPEYSQRARSRSGSDHGGTFVEINITAQHLFFYKNGSLLVESDFVSGDLADGNGTPSGAFGLSYKQRDAILRGPDYRTPVSYWMPFNGGIGLHDATWRNDFGGNYYKSSGSHGCINLPYSVAEKIFNNIEAGDAVFVYELSGTESPKAAAQDAASPVIAAIDAIGEVTLESGPAIDAARQAYEALSDSAKNYVKNYDTLLEAETTYAELWAWQQAEQAAQQQAQQQQAAQQQAQNEAQAVINAISAIGTVTLEQEAAIVNARNQYNALSDLAKSYVTNINVLTAAEQQLQELKNNSAAGTA